MTDSIVFTYWIVDKPTQTFEDVILGFGKIFPPFSEMLWTKQLTDYREWNHVGLFKKLKCKDIENIHKYLTE